jgi:lipopolysaccharide transport system ATP-binding protein
LVKAIVVENIGKRYQLGASTSYQTLRESLTNAITAPFRRRSAVEKTDKEYIWALKDVTFSVEEGEVLGIIGRNGAGKSTLLKILTRVTTPTEGSIAITGRVGSLLEVGTGFHPELTGRENVFLNGAILGMTKKEINRKFDEIAAFSGVEKFLDTPLKRYSSGMQVRLAFGVAAHLEPDILLIDEVLAVGDYEFQQKCFGKMREIGRQGRTVLVVSHQLNNISSLCSRTILLDKGKIAMSDETSKVIEHYIASSRHSPGKVSWPDPQKAPGSEKLRLHSVATAAADGKISGELDVHEEMSVKISFWSLKDGQKPVVGCAIKGPVDEVVCYSATVKEENILEDENSGSAGLYEAECRFPARFFNTVTYTVDLSIQIGFGQRRPEDIVISSILSFTMFSLGQHDKTWLSFPGSVHPVLSWRIKSLEK